MGWVCVGVKDTRNAHSIWMWKPRVLLLLKDWNENNIGVCVWAGDGRYLFP